LGHKNKAKNEPGWKDGGTDSLFVVVGTKRPRSKRQRENFPQHRNTPTPFQFFHHRTTEEEEDESVLSKRFLRHGIEERSEREIKREKKRGVKNTRTSFLMGKEKRNEKSGLLILLFASSLFVKNEKKKIDISSHFFCRRIIG